MSQSPHFRGVLNLRGIKFDNFPDGLEIAKSTDLSTVRIRRNTHDGALDKYQARAILGAFKRSSSAGLMRKKHEKKEARKGRPDEKYVVLTMIIVALALCYGIGQKIEALSGNIAIQSQQNAIFQDNFESLRKQLDEFWVTLDELQKSAQLQNARYCEREVARGYSEFITKRLQKETDAYENGKAQFPFRGE